MGISIKSQKMLWGRAANRCSFADCKLELVMDGSDLDDSSIVGEECHIIARSDIGPRGDSTFPNDKRDDYSNLILLCNVHHKLVDDQVGSYSVEKLHEMKDNHEKWVRESLKQYDAKKQHDEEVYAMYIEEWQKRSDLDNWQAWTSFVLGGQPEMSKERYRELVGLREWLFARIWPKRYLELEKSMLNYGNVLGDYLNIFAKYAIRQNDLMITEKFYHIDEWNPEKYEMLVKRYDKHVALVEALIMELTCAANHICDCVRKYLSKMFRIREGVLLVISGPYEDFKFKTHRPEYVNGEQDTSYPYPGLDKFKEDYHLGE